jgi:hypothetical protein
MNHTFPQVIAQNRNGAVNFRWIYVSYKSRANPYLFHSFQVFGNSLFRNVVVYPLPVAPNFVGVVYPILIILFQNAGFQHRTARPILNLPG